MIGTCYRAAHRTRCIPHLQVVNPLGGVPALIEMRFEVVNPLQILGRIDVSGEDDSESLGFLRATL